MVLAKEAGGEMGMPRRLALAEAGVRESAVDHITAHATATPIGDPVEVAAIRHLFKGRADRILVNATKSMIGHTLGAAGAVAGIACVLAVQTGLVHPTINYDDPHPACAIGGSVPPLQAQEPTTSPPPT